MSDLYGTNKLPSEEQDLALSVGRNEDGRMS